MVAQTTTPAETTARGLARIDAKLSGVPDGNGNIPGRVAQGVALLDEQRPGWADEIDLDALDLASPCRCILGQTWDEDYDPGDEETPYYEHVTRLFGGIVHYDAEIAHGFNADDDGEFPALTAEWRRVILARRGGAQ